MGGDVNIPCSFTIKNPPIDQQYLAIFWYFHGKEILRVQNNKARIRDPRVSYTGRAEDGIADLSISNITIMDGGIYKCSILYTPKREEKGIRLDIQAPPHINITDRVVTNEESSLQSVISGFYPEEIDIKWLRDGAILDKFNMEKPQRDQDGTYHVRSSVTLTPTEEDRERIFSCRVQHESLTAPLQEDFQLVYGDIPTVQIISQEFRMNVEQKLVCNVSGFYPESITVNWFLNDTLLENAKTRRISSSAMESVYLFTPTEQNWGMELRCVVEHGTLTTPHVERLLVQGADMKAQYKWHIVIASVVLVLILFGVGTIIFLFGKQKKSYPKVRRITRSSGATFSLTMDHFYPDITVCWNVFQPPSSTEPQKIGSTTVMQQNQDLTFNATSTCESLRGKIQEDKPYIVQAVVEHNKLKHPKHRQWRSNGKDNEV
ncbi:signal-regulatory protein beta-1-like [Lithobates pipiens]